MAADGSIIIDTRINTKGFSKGVSSLESSAGNAASKLSTGFKKLGVVIAAAFSVQQVIQFGVASSKAARELSDALTGLQSIVEGQGRSFSDAQAFIEEYTQDGLIPATNAITAYKNLALRGYDDSQIRQVMTALKDASAYGRQASYTMGEAVQSATEGLKNENSILVDNAGVTKNVAKMWEDYAESIGTTAANLTQQQKIQAEVTGIMEETKFQAGDATKAAGTLSGQFQRLSFNFNNLKVAVGNVINPIVQYVLPTINTLLEALTKVANMAASVVSLLFGKVTTSNGIAAENTAIAESASAGAAAEEELAKATESAGKAANKALAGFDELNILQGNAGGSSGSSAAGSSAASGGSAGSVATTEIEDTISPKLQQLADKIKKLIEPLKKINFKPAQNALTKLGNSFAKLGRAIGGALEWAWTDILVPFGKWTIEKAAPLAVETLAAAFDLVAAVLEPVTSGLDKMMDYLKPVIAYIAGNALLVINDWRQRFAMVADTMRKKSPEIEGLLSNLGEAFALLWTVIGPVMTKLQQITKKTMTLMNTEFSIGVGYIIDVLYGLTEFLNGALTGDWKRAWSGIEKIFNGTTDAMAQSAAALEKATGINFTGMYEWATKKVNGIKTKVESAWNSIKTSNAWATISTNLKNTWANLYTNATTKFNGIRDKIISAWNKIVEYLSGKGIDFSVIKDSLTNTFKSALNKLISGINSAIGSPIKKLNIALLKFKYTKVLGKYPFSGISMLPVPQIPYLAQGAVIPPNAPFMAMLGDQRHGTNIEAPLETIQEAVALVMEDMVGGMMAGFESTVAVLREILEVILGIEIGDEVIANAVKNYNRKMAVVKGG